MAWEPAVKSHDEGAFLGIQPPYCDEHKSRFFILPVPYDGCPSATAALLAGPRSIIEASRRVEHFDEELWRDFGRVGICTLPESLSTAPPPEMVTALEQQVAGLLRVGKRPILLGGDNAVTLGGVMGALRQWPGLSVLQFGAHANLREEAGGSRHDLSCMATRIAAECPLVQVGVRSLSEAEAGRADTGRVTTIMAGDIVDQDFPAQVVPLVTEALERRVWISLDADVLDPAAFPAVARPEPGGLDFTQLCRLLRGVIEEKEVVGMDLVGTSPQREGDHSPYIAARLAYKFICYSAQFLGLNPIKVGH
jgi:agmatinase